MKKKILFIQSSLGGGGAEKVLIDMLSNFDYTKFDVSLLLFVKNGVYVNDVDKRVKQYHLCENIQKNYFLRFALKIYAWFNCKFLLKWILNKQNLESYDYIISFMEGIPLILHSIINKKNAKSISWVHIDMLNNHWTNRFFSKGAELDLYQKLDEIVFVSSDALKQFDKLFIGVHTQKRVILNPILKDKIIEMSKVESISCNKTTIISVGRLAEQKRYDRLIRVAKIVKDKGFDVDFWILGVGGLDSELKRLAKDLDVDIKFLGFQRNPYAYMAAADIFLSTSSAEGYPLVVAESLCLGKPIVSTKSTGPIEMLNNGEYGVLTDHDDESIANGLLSLLESSEQRTYYSKQAIKRSETFDIEKTMNEVYKSLK